MPEILEWWNYEKNAPNRPEDYTLYGAASVYLNCPDCGAEFYRRLGDSFYFEEGVPKLLECPICADIKVQAGINDLQTTHPELAKEYSPNNERNVRKIRKSHVYPVKWICPTCSGEYVYDVCDREVGDASCPYCADLKVLAGFNDLQTTHPELAKEYSPNNAVDIREVMKSSWCRALWICPTCLGEYACTVHAREVGDDSCPYCADRKVLEGFNDLQTTHSELAREYSPNNEREVRTIMKRHAYSALWICPTCLGEYACDVREREVGDDSCPYCTDRKALAGFNDLQTTHPELAKEYSPNNVVDVRAVRKSSRFRALWICPTCSGEYACMVHTREVGDDSCPYCADRKVLEGFNDLQTTHSELAREYSPNNEQDVRTIMKRHAYSALWICPTCLGEYACDVREREVGDDSCPYCADRKALPGYNTFDVRQPALMKEWLVAENILLGILPDEILETSTEKVWWRCLECDYKYLLTPRKRVLKKKRGHNSCPRCNGHRWLRVHFV